MFGVSFGYVQCVSVTLLADIQRLSSIALLLARGLTAFAVLVAIALLPGRTYGVFRTGILVGIGGFVVAPLIGAFGNADLVTGVVVVIGYTTFDIVTWVLLAQLSRAADSGVVPAFSSGRFLVHAGIVVGFLVTQLVLLSHGPSDVWLPYSTSVGYLLVVAAMLLLSDNSALWLLVRANVDPGSSGGEMPAGSSAAGEPGRREGPDHYDALMEQHGLTEREVEVMRLLLMGRSRPRIAQELCISENTVGTHVQQLYRKLGVHGRQELIDRFS